MYIIAPHFIKDYITRNFSDKGKLSAAGSEFIMESVFVDNDWKRHMSINIDSGLWQCFKTGRSGNFVRLYAEVENLTYFRAEQQIIYKNFDYQDVCEERQVFKDPKYDEIDTSKLEPITINSVGSEDKLMQDAWCFLFGRNLFDVVHEEKDTFYLCRTGRFKNRIIIPFKNLDTVYYFQGRAIYDEKPKYLNPSTDVAAKPSDILYPYDEDSDFVVICEGPLDAKSLQLQGVNATATIGSSISRRQAEILSTFKGELVLGYDNDDAGERGISKFDRLRKELRMDIFSVCPPPSGFKDWNEAHIAGEDLHQWIAEKATFYDFEYQIKSGLNQS